jgi:prolyl oligopeptidase
MAVSSYSRPVVRARDFNKHLGLLVAACVNRAPAGTFGAAVAEVGVLDLLKVRICCCIPAF